MGAGIRVRVFGPVTVEGAAALPGRDRRVLAALVVDAGRVCTTDRLAAALYGDHPPETWRKVVQGSVGRLRHMLGVQAVLTVAGGYRLGLGDEQIDVRRFERLVADADALIGVGEHERAALGFSAALELALGEPFADLDGWHAGQAAAARVSELVRLAEERQVEALLASGQYGPALSAATAQATREPLREQRSAVLALAQYRAGRQGDALRTIRQARALLAEELGLDPGPALIELERAILTQDPGLAGPAPSDKWRASACPYRGLAAYDVVDAEWFFGRERDITECLRIVDATGFVAIVGASGSGKSSLARAGVAPALRRQGREVAVVNPGINPDQLLGGIERSSALVVDQLEGLFVLCDDRGQRARFATALCQWSATAPVVVTLRADHLAEVAELADLAARVQDGIYLLGAMGEPELRAAIEGPAAKAGLRLEPGLVDLLVRDVAGQPGALPLLSHALAETFDRREGPVLTTAGYRAVGGVQGAVARAADGVVDGFPPAGRKAARDLFLRLVVPTDSSEPVRQRVARAAIAVDPTTEAVLDALVQSRLVIADQDTVEVAHEAVCRAWPRLQAWLDEDRDGLRIRQHLSLAAGEWERSGRDPDELYRGPRLVAATDWAARVGADHNDSERAFLTASAARRDAEQHESRRRIRRLRSALTGVGLLLVVSLVAGLLAVRSDQDAREQRDTARAAQHDAQLETLVSQSLALRSTNRALAALLAVEAHRRRPDARSWSALFATFTAAPGFFGYTHVPAERFVTGALVPQTSQAVVALDGRQLMLVDLYTGELEDRFPPPAQDALDYSVVRVSRDGRFVVQLSDVQAAEPANTLTVYERTSGRPVLGPLELPFFAGDVAVDAHGSRVAVAGGPTGELAVYRVADGQLVGTLAGLGQPDGSDLPRDTAAVDFGPDGRLYVGSTLGPIRAVDPSTLVVNAVFDAPVLSSHNQVIATRTLLVAAGDEAVVAIDIATGAIRWSAPRTAGSNACSVLAVAESSGRLYCRNVFSTGALQNRGRVGRLEERDLASGQPTGVVLDPQQGTVGDVAVTADGSVLVTFSYNAPVISRWRLDGTGPVTTRVAHGRVAAIFDPTGSRLLVPHVAEAALFQHERLSIDDLSVWDPVNNRMVDPLDDASQGTWAGPPGQLFAVFDNGMGGFYDLNTGSRIAGVPFAIDGQLTAGSAPVGGNRLYLGYADGRIRTLDATTRGWVEPTIKLGGPVSSLSATSDDARIVATSFHGGAWWMTVHDGRTGEQLGEALPNVNAAQVAPDGTLVAANLVGEISEYDLDTLNPLGSFPGARALVGILRFSDDGKVLAATSHDRTVSIYDVASRTRIGEPIPIDTFITRGTSVRPDGMAVAIGDGNGIEIWDLNPEHLAKCACRLAGRNLTPTEWDTHLAEFGDYRPTCPEYA